MEEQPLKRPKQELIPKQEQPEEREQQPQSQWWYRRRPHNSKLLSQCVEGDGLLLSKAQQQLQAAAPAAAAEAKPAAAAVPDPASSEYPLHPGLSIEQFGARLLGSLQQCLTPAGRAVGRLDAGQHQGCPIVNLRDPGQLDSQPCIVTTPTISKAVSKASGCYYQKLAASDSSAQKGYLYLKVAPGYHEVAHRLVLWAFDGPPQDPLHQVIHLCGRNNCLNPCHMLWGSKADSKALNPTQLQKKRKPVPSGQAAELAKTVKAKTVELAQKRLAEFMACT
ncbi:hypothetical protein V8C86DRAFT_1706670 [Haematococcus lacustris]